MKLTLDQYRELQRQGAEASLRVANASAALSEARKRYDAEVEAYEAIQQRLRSVELIDA